MQKTQSGEIDLIQLLLIIWRKRWLVIFCTFITSLIGVFYYFSTSDIYSAQISIQVKTEQSSPLAFGGFGGFGGQSDDNYGTQVELIKSRKLLIEVVDKLNLNAEILNDRPISSLESAASESYVYYLRKYLPYIDEYIPFLGNYLRDRKEVSTLNEKIQVTQKLQAMLTATHKKNSQFITVMAKSYSPFLATEMVNAIANTYIDYHQKERKTSNDGTSAWLLNELEMVKSDIVQAEKELRIFSESEDLVDIQGVMSLKASELKELSRQQTELEQVVDEHKNQYQAMIGVTDPVVLLNSAMIKANPIIEKSQTVLSEAETTLLKVSLKYGPKHPTYIFAKESLASTKASLDRQIISLIKVVEVEFLTEQKKLEKLKSLFANAKDEFQQLSRLESMFLQKKREVEAHQELYGTVLKKLQEAQTISSLDQELATVFDYALVEDAENTSKRKIGLIISIVSGIIIGALTGLVFGILNQKIWNIDELRRFTSLSPLGSIPKIKNKPTKLRLVPYHEFTKDIVYLESINAIRTRLLATHKSAKVISITSALPEEGKTTISLNLSQSFSELERVLVIDADLRRPSITKMLGLSYDHPGLSDILSREAKLSDCIIRNEFQGFDVLSAGRLLQNSNSLISSLMMPKLLHLLEKYYDRIIIETAPVHLFSDAEVVSKLVDGVLFIVKAEDTLTKDVKSAIEKLEEVGANLLGSILNQSCSSVKKRNYAQYIRDAAEYESNSSAIRFSKQLAAPIERTSRAYK